MATDINIIVIGFILPTKMKHVESAKQEFTQTVKFYGPKFLKPPVN